jgi:cholesterol transport system auxiliary component
MNIGNTPPTVCCSKSSGDTDRLVRLPRNERSQLPIKWVSIALVATLLGACGTGDILQSKVDEPQIYVLKPADTGTAKVAFNYELAVALPTATPGLDSDHISVLRDGNHLDYYHGVRWGGTAAQEVQSFLVASLQSQQGFRGVVAETARVDADYLLEVFIEDFQAEYATATAPVIRVSLAAHLINIKQRKSSPVMHATATVNAAENRLGAVVLAFQSALQQVTSGLNEQLIKQLQ